MASAHDVVSIKDIAKTAGVSHSTVSRALRDSPQVNAATRERIKKVAHEMGYTPDAQARSLVTGRSHTVGVVVTTIADPFVAEVVQGVETTAHDHGYTVVLSGSGSEPVREIAAVQLLRSKRVDGVIVTSSRIGALYLEHVERFGVPVVLINNHNEQSGHYTYTVTVDNRHGSLLAMDHLLGKGHQRIAYVTGPADHSSDMERMGAYRQALEARGLPWDASLVVPGDGWPDGGRRALEQLMSLSQPPTAVFCYNDLTAIGLMRAAREKSVQVPATLAVVGFDDIPLAAYVDPPLTTIAQPMVEMGRLAMGMLLNLMQTDASDGTRLSDTVVRGTLIVRESA
jgi:LacI family transcriptional regulator, repressor for deo operon, udp, cdd, tsx, nupC, and nupG